MSRDAAIKIETIIVDVVFNRIYQLYFEESEIFYEMFYGSKIILLSYNICNLVLQISLNYCSSTEGPTKISIVFTVNQFSVFIL